MTEPYTTQLGAGLGMISETHTLLDFWQLGMTARELNLVALESGRFRGMSARRLRNFVIECFAPRYLVGDGMPAHVLQLIRQHLSKRHIEQLMFLYTCRANPILSDFVRNVYWPTYAGGNETLANEQARVFVMAANSSGKTMNHWSDSMIRRVTRYLTGVCSDFGLLESGAKSVRRILPYHLLPQTAVILSYDLHLSSFGDNQVVGHSDWELFGLERLDVIEELKRISLAAGLVVQTGGVAVCVNKLGTELSGI